jgi:hypothetical protein
MKAEERKRIRELNGLRLSNLANITIKKAVEAKTAYKTALANLQTQKKTYTPEYIAEETKNVEKKYAAALAGLHDEVTKSLNDLHESTESLQKDLVIDDTWLGVLKTIELAGPSLDHETIQQLNANFAYDQPRLRALQRVYKERGVAYDGGIDKMLYSVSGSFSRVKALAKSTFADQSTSINTFASELAKIAKFEGHEIEANPDPFGFDEAMYKSANLPVS